jgi:methylmalonyl-CoA epimerase
MSMMKLHHIGCLVDDIEASKNIYKNILGFSNISGTIFVPSQKVYVCFIEIGNDTFLELIQPQDETSPLLKYRQKNINYYHLAYLVKNIDVVVAHLCSNDAILLTSFPSEGFNQKKTVFLYSPDRHLIELIEDL